MAVMHVGDRAVVVAHTSHALVRPIAGCHLVRADQEPDTVCNVRAVWRTVGSHECLSFVRERSRHDIVSIRVHWHER